MLKLSKASSPQKLSPFDCITLDDLTSRPVFEEPNSSLYTLTIALISPSLPGKKNLKFKLAKSLEIKYSGLSELIKCNKIFSVRPSVLIVIYSRER